YDIFELDFISAYRPPANAEALSDELWEDLMVTMYYSEARPQDKIKVLRSISHLIFITCMHMRQMVGYFKDPVAEDPDKDPSEREDPFLAREEAFVTFYLRIIDMHNSKQFLVRFEKQVPETGVNSQEDAAMGAVYSLEWESRGLRDFVFEEELSRLRSRLGYCAAFPFIQPESLSLDGKMPISLRNTKFVLNLGGTENLVASKAGRCATRKYHDQRLCVSMLVDLALREKYGNIRDYSLTNEDSGYPKSTLKDGTTDPMTMGVPRSWADLAKLPSAGIFRCRYVCSPEDRQVEFRKKLAQTYGYMAGNFSPSDVAWWTGLKEAGDDVLDLLEFFISRYNHVDEAFRDIDGGVKEGENANTTSNGELTLREFEAGLKDIGCFKFKGPNEKERIGAVFRYLDPGGEGNVSLQEWQILDQLWKEFVLSIQEFVQFLIFVFGEDLEEAWITLDDDESGELSEDEWNKAVADIGYFGPSRVVFALLDGSDDGNISYDEFKVLEKYLRIGLKSITRAISTAKRSSAMETLDGEMAAQRGQDGRDAALLTSEQKLEEARARINGATRAALETEETGFQVLGELARQREGIERINAHVQATDDNISGARRVLVQMYRRAMAKKIALWCMVLILLVTVIVIIYFMIFKHPKK
ncbi:Vti1b, partial [Symbiodinium necroappetens]